MKRGTALICFASLVAVVGGGILGATVRETAPASDIEEPEVGPGKSKALYPQWPQPLVPGALLNDGGGIYWGANGTTIIREPPIDTYSSIRWKFEESGQPFLNTGNGGTMSLTVSSGTACASQKAGIFNHAIICSASSSEFIESVTSPALQPGTTAISWWMWVWPYALNGTNATYMVKEYNSSSYTNPFLTIDIQEASTATGSWCCDMSTNGVLTQVCVAAGSPEHFLLLNQWNFLLCTWDSATGNLGQFHDSNNTGAGTGTATGHNIDYGGGTGRWGICGSTEATGAGNHTCTAFIDDVGIDTTSRCPGAGSTGECSWAQNAWQLGIWGTQN